MLCFSFSTGLEVSHTQMKRCNQWGIRLGSGLGQLRFSTDPVALDVFSIEELKRQRKRLEVDYSPPDSALYKNAALIQLGVSDPARREVVEIVR